ncbi:sensor histidine kinase [Glycomyces harbinensis]|uniref:histidine kinase n=1 Tax=Glycomyces harbinensis TaxID=58114 RepID=A0A1G6QQD2_9ACTN|nr:histidine kinase [Glycomyces harbinensis]SDC94549.1 Signal transduction histidine kinase [Glycomyces harbinensis]
MNQLRRLPELWRRLDVTVRDLPLGLLLAGFSLVPTFQDQATQVGDLPSKPFGPMTVVVLVLLCLPLAGRRRWPAASLALVALGFIVSMLGSYHIVAGTALPIALVSSGAHLERYRRTAGAVLTAAYIALAFALVELGSTEGLEDFVMFYLLAAAGWGVGAWLRATRAAEVERRRHIAEATRTAERTRIARELHDVVTHHVTAMIVQAEAARYLTGTPDRLDQTLKAVGDTGRQATTDLRHLLDLLNPDHGEPRTPPVGRLLTLVEQTRRAGQPVEFTEEGTPAESTGSADLVAYRIVQESLTNALKYAHGSRTSVQVSHRGREITVEVSTDGSGRRSEVRGGGRGLEGLRERVDVLGGEFSAGDLTGGGFVVRARIPAGSPS